MDTSLAFAFPPAHPILVNFTAALIPASFLADFLGRVLRKDSLAHAGFWMFMLAAALTPFTAYTGWDWKGDMFHGPMMEPPQELFWHQWLGFSLAGAAILLGIWRLLLSRKAVRVPVLYLLAALLVTAALVVQGDLGGRMVMPDQYTESPPAAPSH